MKRKHLQMEEINLEKSELSSRPWKETILSGILKDAAEDAAMDEKIRFFTEEVERPEDYGVNVWFTARFITYEMAQSFDEIAQAFLDTEPLLRTAKEEHLFHDFDYPFRMERNPEDVYYFRILGMMLKCARSGSSFSRDLILTLYKTYYRREYNILKRMKTLSIEEFSVFAPELDFEADERDNSVLARVTVISDFLGIKLKSTWLRMMEILNENVKNNRVLWAVIESCTENDEFIQARLKRQELDEEWLKNTYPGIDWISFDDDNQEENKHFGIISIAKDVIEKTFDDIHFNQDVFFYDLEEDFWAESARVLRARGSRSWSFKDGSGIEEEEADEPDIAAKEKEACESDIAAKEKEACESDIAAKEKEAGGSDIAGEEEKAGESDVAEKEEAAGEPDPAEEDGGSCSGEEVKNGPVSEAVTVDKSDDADEYNSSQTSEYLPEKSMDGVKGDNIEKVLLLAVIRMLAREYGKISDSWGEWFSNQFGIVERQIVTREDFEESVGDDECQRILNTTVREKAPMEETARKVLKAIHNYRGGMGKRTDEETGSASGDRQSDADGILQGKQSIPVQKKDQTGTRKENYSPDISEAEGIIQSLRQQLAQAEQKLQNQRTLYEEAKLREDHLKRRLDNAQKEHTELIALRNFTYHLETDETGKYRRDTSDELKAGRTGNDELGNIINELKTRKITIIGGHENWLKKIRQVFPEWSFVGAREGVSLSGAVSSAERVFFYTDILGHSSYEKYLKAAIEQKKPFSFLHGTNLEKVIRAIYEEIVV